MPIAAAQPSPFRELTLTRVFDAPRELVFQAWTDPAHIVRWWGPRAFTTPVCEVDARPGGALRIVMRAPGGSHHAMRGVFREVIVPERLVFTNIAVDDNDQPLIEGLTTVTFAAHGTKTKLTLHTTARGLAAVAGDMIAGMEAGWSQSFDKLVQYLAA